MARNPKRTVGTEFAYHMREGDYDSARELIAHEGLKKGVERGLWVAGSSQLGRAALRRVGGSSIDDPRLRTNVAGLSMRGPVGLAPGWDKTGLTLQAWQALGARHATFGAGSLFSQGGNDTPRLKTMDAVVGDGGINVSQNWFGFNNHGIDQLVYNIFTQKEKGDIDMPVIVQLTINKEFYQGEIREALRPILVETVKRALQLIDGVRVVDGISLGLSSPNTLGMRTIQDEALFLSETVHAAGYTAKEIDPLIKIIYKGDGDGGKERLDLYARMVEVQNARLIDALELINTTRLEHILAKYNAEKLEGGLAGNDDDYKRLAIQSIRHVYERVGGIVDIIGTGGGAHQAFDMIEAGASAVGINTGIRTRGLFVMKLAEREILEQIDQYYPEATQLDQVTGSKTTRGPKYLAKETPEQREIRLKRGVKTGNYSDNPERWNWSSKS